MEKIPMEQYSESSEFLERKRNPHEVVAEGLMAEEYKKASIQLNGGLDLTGFNTVVGR